MDATSTHCENNQTLVRHQHAFTFYGSGVEYFRIWLANILLTLLTFGVYSAWAKVRRMKYFYENTELLGARFGYHADPKKIFTGRLLAILTVGGFYLAAYFYPVIEPLGSIIWVAALPVLLSLALYFGLRNTSYRGLNFAFVGTVKQSYQTLWLPLTLALLGLIALALVMNHLAPGTMGLYLGILVFVTYLLFPILVMPLFHAQWKRYAHMHSFYGNVPFSFDATVKQYAKAYIGCIFVFLGIMIAFGLLALLVVAGILGKTSAASKSSSIARNLPEIFAVIVFLYAVLLTMTPYMKAVFFNLAWRNTQFGAHKFRAALPLWGMVGLAASNLILVLLSLGFYRPFAVIRTQKYLLEHLYIESIGDDMEIFKAIDKTNPKPFAEGALDLFGEMDM
jgi:uncharacterized membrane protein YjgN (DUF898 family)